MITIDNVNLDNLMNARMKFEDFRQHLNTEQEKAGAIQAYEYTYELTWKTMRRLLSARGVITNSPRDTFREAALNQMIIKPETWFEFITIRNLTVRTYNKEVVKQILAVLDAFSDELTLFLKNIGALA